MVLRYWEESMNTLALVIISVPMAIFIGFGLGVWGFFFQKGRKSNNANIRYISDCTYFCLFITNFTAIWIWNSSGFDCKYLIFFPPMVRNTILGLKRVPDHIIESAIMSGANTKQLFWQAMLPSCKKQILLGINQSTMAASSMVIIAAIIGGTADIGWEVLYYIRKS